MTAILKPGIQAAGISVKCPLARYVVKPCMDVTSTAPGGQPARFIVKIIRSEKSE
jgi:hypothetical protein